jgi:hypothetical protein
MAVVTEDRVQGFFAYSGAIPEIGPAARARLLETLRQHAKETKALDKAKHLRGAVVEKLSAGLREQRK